MALLHRNKQHVLGLTKNIFFKKIASSLLMTCEGHVIDPAKLL